MLLQKIISERRAENKEQHTARSMRMTNCFAAAKECTSGMTANSFMRSKMYISSFSRRSSSVTMDLNTFRTLQTLDERKA